MAALDGVGGGESKSEGKKTKLLRLEQIG